MLRWKPLVSLSFFVLFAALFMAAILNPVPARAQEQKEKLYLPLIHVTKNLLGVTERTGDHLATPNGYWHPLVGFTDVPTNLCNEEGHVYISYYSEPFTATFFHGSGDPQYIGNFYIQLERSWWIPRLPWSRDPTNYRLICYEWND